MSSKAYTDFFVKKANSSYVPQRFYSLALVDWDVRLLSILLGQVLEQLGLLMGILSRSLIYIVRSCIGAAMSGNTKWTVPLNLLRSK